MAKQLRLALPELEFEEEAVDPKSGYSIDIRATRSGAGDMWAVEVDGPSHFLQVSEGCVCLE